MIGGLERLTEMTADHLHGAGHEVVVATAATDPEGRSRDFPYEVVRRPGLGRLNGLVRRSEIVHLNTFSGRLAALALAARRPISWQHIDFDTLTPRGICHAFGQPCVFAPGRCYGCLRRDHSRAGALKSIASLFAKRAAARGVAANIVSTRYAQARMRLPRPRFLSFGIDPGHFTPPERRPAAELRIFFTARHVPAKGCDVLVRALGAARDRGLSFQARIAGDGPHRTASEALARTLELGDSVRFIGFQPDDALLAELRAADVVVVPTVQDEIGQFVAFEAMACECAVVASDIGALPEHVGGVGLLFPPGDHEALAGRLLELDADRELMRCLGRKGRERVVADYDSSATGRRYEALFSELASRN
jgi:glycosyltransferase involved in cell wall biosynthesis